MFHAILAAAAISAAPGSDGALVLIDARGGQVKTSLFSPEHASLPVARVGDRAIMLSELTSALGAMHRSHSGGRKAGKLDFGPVLDRLIAVRLIVEEAEAMGLDDLDDFKSEMVKFEESSLRDELQRKALRGVKADPAVTARIYGELTREWKIQSALFDRQDDAAALVAATHGGTSFDSAMKQAIDAKKASGGKTGWFSPRMGMLPPVIEAIRMLSPGQVSPPVAVEKGFAVLRLETTRQRNDDAARAQARAQALDAARAERLKSYYEALRQRRARCDVKLLDSLDFEASQPGFAALEKDTRALATIEGAAPITVADLAAAIRSSQFHGVDQAIREKRINDRKQQFFDSLLSRRLVAAEAASQKLSRSNGHRRRMEAKRDELLFDLFVQQVVEPDVKVREEDLKAYYEGHQREFTYPTFYALQSLAFTSPEAAREAMDKLKRGTDFIWLKRNADGLVPPQTRVLELDGSTISVNALAPDVAKAVAGSRSADVRLLDRASVHYVIVVKQVTESRVQPFAEARSAIAPKVFDDLLNRSLDEWVRKLREAHPVRVYISGVPS